MKVYPSTIGRRLVLSAIMLVSISLTLILFTPAIPRVHAAASLTIQPPSQTTAASGTTLTFNVTAQGIPNSDFAGWDIYVTTTQSALNPTTITVCNLAACNAKYSDVAGGGNFMPPGSETKCINAVPVPGFTSNCGGLDGPGVVHDTFTSGSFTTGSLLLFTVTYTAGATATSNIVFPETGTGCTSTGFTCQERLFDSLGGDIVATEVNGMYGAAPSSHVAVVQGSDGLLYWSKFTSAAWGTWQSLSGASASAPALCLAGPQSVHLVVRGADNGIYHKSFSSGSFSATWDAAPGGQTVDAPSCAVLGSTLYVVVRGVNNNVFYNTLSTTGWGTWTNLGGTTNAQPVIVATNSANRLDLFVVGADTELFHMPFIGGTPSRVWDAAPNGLLASIPAVVSDGTGIDVVVRGFSFSGPGAGPVWFNRYVFSTATWAGWQFLNGYAKNAPAITIDSPGTIRVAVTGVDNAVYTISKPATGVFGTWTNLGGLTTSRPTIAASGNTAVLLVRGNDGHVFSNFFSGSAWSVFTGTSAIASADPVASAAQ